ncbi:MAG: flagellar hook-length control protein FliK [Defluviitaleaceae bacterium]|nr:flagellar hook-length control protein FliK [Defluviitaleaceae bacterium]
MDIIIKNELQKLSASQNVKHIKKAAELVKFAVSSNAINISDANVLKSILLEAGLPLNDDTLLLVQNLLENDIPVNKETLTKLKQAMRMYKLEENIVKQVAAYGVNATKTCEQPTSETGVARREAVEGQIHNQTQNKQKSPISVYSNEFTLPKIMKQPAPVINPEALQKAIFTLANDIAINKSNINAVVQFAENSNFYKQLTEISESLELLGGVPVKTKESDQVALTVSIKEAVAKMLIPERNNILGNEPIKESLLQKFSMNLNEPREQIDKKLEDLHKNLSQSLEFIETLEDSEHKTELNNLKQILMSSRDYCALLPQLKDAIFIPLPINIIGRTEEAELYILKNNKKNKGGGVQSALLSLNMQNMGKIESYIQKEENTLSIQFKIESIEVKDLIKRDIQSLRTLLGAYNLKNVTYLDFSEPFNLVKEIEIKAVYDNYSTIDHML